MKTILIIAKDSIRALLHQRLLIALMLASFALTIVFSIALSSMHKNIRKAFNGDAAMSGTSTSDTTVAIHTTTITTISGTNQMSEKERRAFREQMDSTDSIMQGAFYGVCSFGGSLVALFIFASAVSSEIRRGTIRLTLSKPVSRTEYLLGKYLGGVAVMAAYALIASIAMMVFAQSQGVDLNPAVKWAPWMMFCRQLMLGSVAMLFSLFVHPAIAGVLAYFAGNGLYPKYFPLYWILPSYGDFNLLGQVLKGSLIDWKDILYLSLYAADFIAIVLLLALWRFRNKELVR